MKSSETIFGIIERLLAEVESLRSLEQSVRVAEAQQRPRPGGTNTRADRFLTGSFAARIVWFLAACAPDEGLPAQTIGDAIDNPNLRSVRSLCYDLETRGHLKIVSPGRFVTTRKGVRTYEVVGVTRTPLPPVSTLDSVLAPKFDRAVTQGHDAEAFLAASALGSSQDDLALPQEPKRKRKRTPAPAPDAFVDPEVVLDEDGLDLDDLPDVLQDELAVEPEKFTAKRVRQLIKELGDDADDDAAPEASTLSDEEFARIFGATIEKKE